MVDKEEISNIFYKNFASSYGPAFQGLLYIHEDGTIDADGNIELKKNYNLPTIPLKFGEVRGTFRCSFRKLKSLEGCPQKVTDVFSCSSNKLITLTGGPVEVNGIFSCDNNKLTSLEGAPKYVGKEFFCNNNKLKSLNGIPDYIGEKIHLDYSPNLPLLKLLVAKGGVEFWKITSHPYAREIENVLNQFKGQGKRGFLAATSALLKLEKELQKEDPSISIRENIKW